MASGACPSPSSSVIANRAQPEDFEAFWAETIDESARPRPRLAPADTI